MDTILVNLTQGAYKLAMQLLQQPADANDVLQDAAAVAISHGSAPAPDSTEFRSWFFRVVRNKAIDKLRQQKRLNHEQLIEDNLLDQDAETPDSMLEKNRLQQQVKSAIAALSLQQREIILLKDYHDFSYADIAHILDIPKGSVMSRLHRARMALKTLLTPHMVGDKNE